MHKEHHKDLLPMKCGGENGLNLVLQHQQLARRCKTIVAGSGKIFAILIAIAEYTEL